MEAGPGRRASAVPASAWIRLLITSRFRWPGRRATARPPPPVDSACEPLELRARGQRLQAGDTLLGARVRAEQAQESEPAVPGERVDDRELRTRRIHLHRDPMRVRLEAPERAREGERLAADQRTGPVRLVLVLAADHELKDHRRDRRDDRHGEE